MLCGLRCEKARLGLWCKKLSTAHQLEPRFKTAKVTQHFCLGMAYQHNYKTSIRYWRTFVIKEAFATLLKCNFVLLKFLKRKIIMKNDIPYPSPMLEILSDLEIADSDNYRTVIITGQ